MALDQNQDTVKAALVDLNAAREILGLPTLAEVPEGTRQEATDCPMYHGLKNGHAVEVTATRVFVNADEDTARAIAAAWGVDPDEYRYSEYFDYDIPGVEAAESGDRWVIDQDGAWQPAAKNEAGDAYTGEHLDGFYIRTSEAIEAFVTEFDKDLLNEAFDR